MYNFHKLSVKIVVNNLSALQTLSLKLRLREKEKECGGLAVKVLLGFHLLQQLKKLLKGLMALVSLPLLLVTLSFVFSTFVKLIIIF